MVFADAEGVESESVGKDGFFDARREALCAWELGVPSDCNVTSPNVSRPS